LGEELLSRWAGLVLCLLAAPAAAVGSPRVSAVELRGDAPFERVEQLHDLIAVEPGEPLEAAAVARSLRNLHAYGSAGEIVAFTEPRPDGLAVIFGLWARVQVGEVRLEGDLGLRRAQLMGALPQRPRQPLSESKVIRGVWALQDLYTRFGYRQRLVQVAVATNTFRRQAVVAYQVEAGPRARVGEVTFSGETVPFSAGELRRALRSETGRFHHEATTAGDVERLQGWLIERGFRRAEVDPPLDRYDPVANRVDLEFPLRLGPRFDIVAPGVDLKRLQRKELLPFLETERFDPALLIRSRDALRRHFQERGHYHAGVDLEQEETAEGVTLRLAIEPGPVFSLAAVRFVGNQSFASDQLAALMETSPARRLGSGGRLVDEIVEDDLDNLRSFYALEGFGEAAIGPVEVERLEVERQGSSLELVVPIVEGPRRRVVNLSFQGCDALPAVALLEGLTLAPAGPYHPRLLEQSLDQIRARYEAAGMRAAQVTAELFWNEERSLVDVLFKVFEGPRSVVERVVIRGQQRTRPFIIRRAAGFGRDQPISTERLLEAQRRLYGLGVFSRVDVKLAAGTPFSAERDVVVRVEEGARRNVTYGFGYDSEDGARGLLGVGHRNLFGRAIAGRFDVRASQRETQIRALVRQPFLGNSGWPVSYSLFRIEESRDSFDSKRRGAQIEGLRLSGSDRYGLLMSYRKVQVEVEDADPALQDLEIERALQEVEIFSLGPSLFVDRRDDPFEPRRGWSTNLVLEAAQPLANADVELLKLFGQQTYNLDLRRFGVLAASLRLGAIEPGGGNAIDPTVEGLLSAQVPISERFFAGGRSSHRAYRRDRLGIAGETVRPFTDPDQPDAVERLVPVGGTGLALLNLDYRFPVWGALGGVAFIDAGNVWADWRDIDPGQAKVGAGVGLRYLSPLGPIRAEIGWKLDREPLEDSWVATLSVGNPF
jgi:outer membrane protein insertion porin family